MPSKSSETIDSVVINDDRGNAVIVFFSAIAKVDLYYLDPNRHDPHEQGVRIVLNHERQGYPDTVCCFGEQAIILRRYLIRDSGRSLDLRPGPRLNEDDFDSSEECGNNTIKQVGEFFIFPDSNDCCPSSKLFDDDDDPF